MAQHRTRFPLSTIAPLLVASTGCTDVVDEARASTEALNVNQTISIAPIGRYETGVFAGQAAEIVAYDHRTHRLFVVNTAAGTIDAIDIDDPTDPQLAFQIDITQFGPRASSVAVHPNHPTIAAVIPNANAQAPGAIAFYTTDGAFSTSLVVGSNPDKVAYTPNGRYALVSNEGIPSNDYLVDPEGTISIIDVANNMPTQNKVRTADFHAFNNAVLDESVRIFGPNATVAQDLEPEDLAVSDNSQTAWVALQEGNAVAVVDIQSATVTDVMGLGFKDHNLPGNAFDPSDRDNGIHIANWPVMGMYLPDGIASFRVQGNTYLALANEGNARELTALTEERRVSAVALDPMAFPNGAALKANSALGRLRVTSANGDTDGDGDYDVLYSFGTRSFSIVSAAGDLVFESGDDFEQITAAALPTAFNSNNDVNNSFDTRSDDKGPEPEGIAVGTIGNRTFAFVSLERISGIMVYEVTQPSSPEFVQYVNPRNFAGNPALGTAGDLGPEGMAFIAAHDSPNQNPLLAVANEVSGTTTVYEISYVDK